MNISGIKNQFNEENASSFIKQYINDNAEILEISQYNSNVFNFFKNNKYNIKNMNFEDLVNSKAKSEYDVIYCIFNQLNFIENLSELAIITKKAFSMLKPKGFLILQFINSDKILKNSKKEEIGNNIFEKKEQENQTFIKLTYPNKDEYNLTPVLFTDIQTIANKLGAYYVRFYGGYDNSKFFKPESKYLIAVIIKSEKPVDMSKQAVCSLV